MAITLIIKMRQPDSFSTKCSIPIYSIISPRSNDFIYAGGGGQSKSGIANAIVSDENLFGKYKIRALNVFTRYSFILFSI